MSPKVAFLARLRRCAPFVRGPEPGWISLKGMMRDRSQPGERSAKGLHLRPITLLSFVFCFGCASPGPPRPPSLHLPEPVKDLSAERVGDHVVLRWTTPSQTTDGMAIAGTMTAEVCRQAGLRPPTPAERAAACAPVRRGSVAPGPSELTDPLPSPLEAGPPVLLTYRVQIYNAAGRSAGESAAAFAAAGEVPSRVEDLRATASERGAIIEWRSGAGADAIDLLRTDLSAPAATAAKAKAKTPTARPAGKGRASTAPKPHPKSGTDAGPVAVHLLAADAGGQGVTAGTVDMTATMGETYTYVAERVRGVTVGGHSLELHSEPSSAATVAMRDTFPPAPPTGLATIAGFMRPDAKGEAAPYIDLSWEANREADLAGYLVYRELVRRNGDPQGPLARLTPLPIPAPAYRDVAVRPGQRYSYHVTAVDASGNESAPSAKALEIVRNP